MMMLIILPWMKIIIIVAMIMSFIHTGARVCWLPRKRGSLNMSHMLPILLIKGVSSEVVLRPMGLLWKVCRKGRTPPSHSGRLPWKVFSIVGPLNLCLFTQRSTKNIAPSTNIKHHKYLAVQTHKDPDLPKQQGHKNWVPLDWHFDVQVLQLGSTVKLSEESIRTILSR